MGEIQIDRRNLLKAGSSLSIVTVAGCSGQDTNLEDNDSPTGNESEEAENDVEESNEGPSKPEALAAEDHTLSEEHTVDEWHSTLELTEEQPHWTTEIVPPEPEDNSIRYGKCHVLECEIDTSDSILSDDKEASLALIPENSRSKFEDALKLENCWEPLGIELSCTTNLEQYDRDGVSGDVVEIEPGDTKYARYLLPDRDFLLAIDGSNAVGGEYVSIDPDRSVSEMDIKTRVRVLDHSFETAQSEAVQAFQGWFSGQPDSPEQTMSDAQKFAQEVCESTGANEVSSEPVEVLEDDIDQVEEYGEFIEDVLQLANNRYQAGFPVDIVDRFNRLVKWGSTMVPIVASAVAVAENACDLAHADLDSNEEESAEKVEAFLSSVAGLAVQIIFLKWGVVRQVSRAVVKPAKTFVLGYMREIAGLRLFAYLVKNIVVKIDQGIVQAVREFAERIIAEVGEFITESDLDVLDGLSKDDSWKDMAFIEEEDCTCENLGSTEVCMKKISV
ncbi:hypothetical protein HYG81_26645 (plasmid) [Natrinema zhouii]|uniref:hypothetical protein n=1 Tax=Natrinema zhouii TaxID=1710539 RepID=UPI001CFFA13D|nr:hypothetical protein [Natrinema zhouii]UHQ99211.1 hypothetical protein HYG81_26645 [Natrinema zhouii]